MVKRVVSRLAVALGGVVVLIAGYVGLVLAQAWGSVPDWSGELAVDGLTAPVEILRDEQGVAHLFASTREDLAFAQGFVHAQDRFWQMAVARQSAAGRLSEWFGAVTLRVDRRRRMEGGTAMADRLWASFPEAEKPILQAYAAGVNAWLASPAYRRAPELRVLHVEPEPWSPRDTFLVYRQLYTTLAHSGWEAHRARLKTAGAAPAAMDMMFSLTRIARPIIGDQPADQPTGPFKQQGFSDSWTLSGAHTASGKPLMANDPQLPATMPNFWHLQHHGLPGLDVVGVSIPGLPGIALGHNGHVAWGATNANVDVNDIALLEVDPADPRRYRRGPDEPWEAFRIREERHQVRLGEPFVETVRETPLGFVMPADLWLPYPLTERASTVTEVHLHGLDVESSPAAFLRINQARDVPGALEGLAAFTGPLLNLSLADTTGRIAYLTAGRMPVRPEAHGRQVGFFPDDDNRREYLPPSENPRVVDPPSGRIVTANQLIMPVERQPAYLNDFWNPPERTDRIHELLDEVPRHDAESFRRMQSDTLHPVARRVMPFLLAVKPATPEDQVVVDVLEKWDFRFDLESSAPVAFLTWYELLGRRILMDELGPKFPNLGPVAFATEYAFTEHPEWCDDVRTPARETCDQALAASLTEARIALTGAFGASPEGWAWGRTQSFVMPHLGFDGVPVLGGLFSRRVPRPGGPESLFVNGLRTFDAPRFSRSDTAPSYQAIYDLARLEASLFMMSGGQSGHFASPRYDDLTPRWLAGERFTIPVKRDALTPVASFTLRPEGAGRR